MTMLASLVIFVCLICVVVAAPAAFEVDTSVDKSVEGSWACRMCTYIVKHIDKAIDSHKSKKEIKGIGYDVCIIAHGGMGYKCRTHAECKDLCEGAMNTWGDEVIDVLSKSYLGTAVCSKIDLCPASNTASIAEESARAERKKSSKLRHLPIIENVVPKPMKRGPVTVMQLTDVHVDVEYTPGRDNDCGLPICCRSDDAIAPTKERTSGIYGDLGYCDTSPALFSNLVSHLSSMDAPPTMAFLTGDYPEHAVWKQSPEHNLGLAINVTKSLFNALPHTQFFPSLGNHEFWPVDQANQNISAQAWLYDGLAKAWGHVLPPSALATFRKGGYYIAPVASIPGHHVISLNLNLHQSGDFWLLLGEKDTGDMLAWYAKTLADLELKGETAYVIGHQPASDGTPFMLSKLEALALRYNRTITASFYGHTHKDSFRLINDVMNSTSVGVQYVASSITTYGGRNPSYRMYELESGSPRVSDYKVYRVDFAAQGLLNNVSDSVPEPRWELAYSAKNLYGLPNLEPKAWRSLVGDLWKNDDLFSQFYDNFITRPGTAFTGADKKSLLCMVSSSTVAEKNVCNKRNFGMDWEMNIPISRSEC